jgi:O-antigen/teichoic acid export membrane protein
MTEVEEIKRKSVIGVVSYSFRQAFLFIIAIIATALLSAYLSPSDYGVYYVVLSVIGVFTFLSDIGLAAALVQMKTEPTLEDLRTSFTIQQGLAFTIFILIVGLTPVWRRYAGLNQQGLYLLYALGFSFIMASFKTIPSILLERKLAFNTLIIPQIVEQLVFYSIAVVLAKRGMGITSFTAAVVCRSMAGLIAIYILKPWSIGLAFSKRALNTLMGIGLKFQANDLLARLKDDLYVVVLSKFISPTELGYIGWAKKWTMFPYTFTVQNVVAVTFPTFSRLQQEKNIIARGLELSVYFICLTIFPILMGMAVLAYPLTVAIPAYLKWQPALPSLYLFCINIALAAMANPFVSALNAMGRINTTLKLMMVMTAATWLLTPFVWHWYGYLAVAIVSVLVAAIGMGYYVIFNRMIKVNLWVNIRIPLVSSLIMGAAVLLSQKWITPTLLHLVIMAVWGMIIFTISVLLFGSAQFFKQLKLITPRKI